MNKLLSKYLSCAFYALQIPSGFHGGLNSGAQISRNWASEIGVWMFASPIQLCHTSVGFRPIDTITEYLISLLCVIFIIL